MMSDKVWGGTMIVLGVIAAILIAMCLILDVQHKNRVDCDSIRQQNNGVNYVPTPKQCEK